MTRSCLETLSCVNLSKLHPRSDDPFVVLASTDKDTYQLATANGYRLPNLVNIARIHMLDKVERQRYTEDFWDASTRLRLHNRVAKDQTELYDVNKRLAEGTHRHLNDQRQGKHHTLAEIDQLAREKRQTEKSVIEVCTAQEALANGSPEVQQSSRPRQMPVRFENA